jgi:hypothetical protein
MADARPDFTAVLVAGWPAVAFAVAFELLLQQRRAARAATSEAALVPPGAPRSSPPPIPTPAMPIPAPSAAPAPRPRAADGGFSGLYPAVSGPETTGARVAPAGRESPFTPAITDDVLVTRVRALLATPPGQSLGRRAVAKRLTVTEHQARPALDTVTTTTGAALNGTAGRSEPKAAGRGAGERGGHLAVAVAGARGQWTARSSQHAELPWKPPSISMALS